MTAAVPALRALTVAVGDHYARTLATCLAPNMRHLAGCLVVTTPRDEAVKAVAAGVPGVSVLETDAFTFGGAAFNKGWALELGFDVLGRHGWLAVIDADICLPPHFPSHLLREDRLHGARRRILADPAAYRPGLDWRRLPLYPGGAPIGYLQVFHADAPVLRRRRPWYDVTFAHAAGSDAAFVRAWPKRLRTMLPCTVLHLGVPCRHWFGSDPAGRDATVAFLHRKEYRYAALGTDATALDRVGELLERVAVPGYPPPAPEPLPRRPVVVRAVGRR